MRHSCDTSCAQVGPFAPYPAAVPREGSRVATLGVASLVMAVGLSAPAAATGESVPAEAATIPAALTTHFYDITVDQVPAPVGSPYLAPIGGTTLLTLDWDHEVGVVDIATRAGTALGTLPLPIGARVLDVVSRQPVASGDATGEVMLAYAWREQGGCRRSTLREATIDLTGAGRHALGRTWFRTPCYPSIPDMVDQGLSQAGGRIAGAPRSMRASGKPAFLFTVGDFELSRRSDARMPAQARRLLGTVLLVDAPGNARVYATGLRNAQGITVAGLDGGPTPVVSEHGPRGGDDIDVLTEGADFGWPRVSFGTAYSASKLQNRPLVEGYHRSGTPPLFSFVPSIGPTSILEPQGRAFRRWWGSTASSTDLLVNGMGAKSIVRLRVMDGAVRYAETIRTGVRLRTLVQLPNGWLVGGLDWSSPFLLVLRPAAAWDPATESFLPAS